MIIVIPVYEEIINSFQIVSLKQCFKMLHLYPVCIACAKDLSVESYINLASACGKELAVERFDNNFFESVAGYNKLMLSTNFYKRFNEYQFMLLHQTDVYVFKDELDYWCSCNYDFIGAPWFEGWDCPLPENKIIGVGNGGFSLRNISASLRLLKRINILRRLRQFWYKSHLQAIVRFEKFIRLLSIFFKIKDIKILNDIFFDSLSNEDYYWTQTLAKCFNDYHVAPVEDASQFSFDANPSLLFSMNNNELPFGCHAWQRYEPSFWSKHIHID